MCALLAREHCELSIERPLKPQSMPNNIEFSQRFLNINEKWGGSVFGESFDGDSRVALTKYGLTVVELFDGDLVADFADNGLICSYDKEGRLEDVSIDLEDYFYSLSTSETAKMPHKGSDLRYVAKLLHDTDTTVVLTADVKTGKIEVETVNEEGDIFKRDVSPSFDLTAGMQGELQVGNAHLAFSVEIRPDEFVLGIGEQDEGSCFLDAIVISKNVGKVKESDIETPRGIQMIASKILLN